MFDNSTAWKPLGPKVALSQGGFVPGDAVAISASGTIIAVGSSHDTDKTGVVRVFGWNDATMAWIQLGQDMVGTRTGDEYGSSLAISADGTIVAAGAQHNDDGGFDSGHVRVFEYNGNTWQPLGQTLVGEAAADWFGHLALDLSSDGGIVAVGAFKNDAGPIWDAGEVKVYKLNDARTQWLLHGGDAISVLPLQEFGSKLALSSDGSVLAVAGRAAFGTSGRSYVRVFAYNGTSYEPLGQLLQSSNDTTATIDDGFGLSLALDDTGTRLAVGAPFGTSSSGGGGGFVRVYQLDHQTTILSLDNNTNATNITTNTTTNITTTMINTTISTWIEIGDELVLNNDATTSGENDDFGYSVSMSGDGNLLLVGAPGANNDAGLVRAYVYDDNDDSNWIQVGEDLFGDVSEDLFGSSVATSTDGVTWVVGAIGFQFRGYVRVYRE